MKIFVTGGSGFLGQHLIRRLKEEGHVVISPSSALCDLRDPASLLNFSEPYELIYHLAAFTQAGDWCLYHTGEQWLINQQINTNVLNWWHEVHPGTKMIAIGTSCSYAAGSHLVETDYMVGQPVESLYTYAMTKRMLLQGLRAIAQQYDSNFLYVVPSTLYGAGYHQDGRQMHFIFDLIRKVLHGKELGSKVTLWGDGYQSREVIHVDDFISNLFGLVDLDARDIFNLGSGEEYNIRYFAEKICNATGYDFNLIDFDVTKYVGARNKMLNVQKARSYLKDYAARDLENGISEVVSWFKETKAYD